MPRTVDIEISKAELKKLTVGESVTVVTKGKIKALRDEDSYELLCCGDGEDKQEKIPPRVELEVSSTKVRSGNAFAEMSDDDDEED